MPQRLERREPVSYFCLCGAHQLTNEYDPLIYGIQQASEGIDCETTSLFTSTTDKGCLGDLLNSRIFAEESENVIK